jgi:hypothetical protein
MSEAAAGPGAHVSWSSGWGHVKQVTHLVDVDVAPPSGSIGVALCGASVRLGAPEELRLGQIPDCLECWERFSSRRSGFSLAEAVMEATVDGGEESGRGDE